MMQMMNSQMMFQQQPAIIPQQAPGFIQPQPQMIPQPAVNQAAAIKDVIWLKQNLATFQAQYPQEEQKNILGNMMYQKVNEINTAAPDLVPKITGMLIDLEVLGLPEIVEILENKELLYERMQEAIKIIEEDENN